MADWLSQCSGVGVARGRKTSPMSRRSQRPSFAACVAATYSASVVESATISCFLAPHETAPPSMRKAYPLIALRCSCILPSASVYPSNPFLLPRKLAASHSYLKDNERRASEPPSEQFRGLPRTARGSRRQMRCRGACQRLPTSTFRVAFDRDLLHVGNFFDCRRALR
jgi:hypothetical protein